MIYLGVIVFGVSPVSAQVFDYETPKFQIGNKSDCPVFMKVTCNDASNTADTQTIASNAAYWEESCPGNSQACHVLIDFNIAGSSEVKAYNTDPNIPSLCIPNLGDGADPLSCYTSLAGWYFNGNSEKWTYDFY